MDVRRDQMDHPEDPFEGLDVPGAFDLTGTVAVVTGGGRGIGEGIARVLGGAGAHVVVAARRVAEIEAVAAGITDAGGSASSVSTDVTDRHQLERLAAHATERGDLRSWVNNAGGSANRMPLTDMPRDAWDGDLDLNLTAVWEASVVAAEAMSTGAIVNISSMASHGPTPGSGHYAAAKAGVNSLTMTMARELAPDIRVNCIAPGWVPTEIVMEALDLDRAGVEKMAARIPMGRLGTPVDLGLAALWLCAPASAWITGQVLDVAGGS